MKTVSPKEISPAIFQAYLQGAVAPRPIAFASTIDAAGNVNLSPFSFFNVFSSNPPILIFSPSRRVRDNTTKHSLENVLEVGEVVINIVNFSMVEQTSLASTEYEKGVNEFIKAGFTAVPSTLVKPPRVAESPAAFECVVKQVMPLGDGGGAGNLVICEVILAHFHDDIFNEKGQIEPSKIDLVSRMGGDWYCRANGNALFEVPKPLQTKGIGVDNIPTTIRNSNILTGNDLGRLGNVEKLPTQTEIDAFRATETLQNILNSPKSLTQKQGELYLLAKQYLQNKEIESAWKVLLIEPQQ